MESCGRAVLRGGFAESSIATLLAAFGIALVPVWFKALPEGAGEETARSADAVHSANAVHPPVGAGHEHR